MNWYPNAHKLLARMNSKVKTMCKGCSKSIFVCIFVCVCVNLHLFEYITLYEHSNTVMPSLIPFIQCGGNKGLISLVYF